MSDPTFSSLSDIKARKVKWFWEPLIPYEMITILEGDPGTGKSFIAMHLAAEVSRGGALPNGKKLKGGRVLYISAEDDPAYTTRPRIEAMGGDPKRIRVLTGQLVFDDDGLSKLDEELDVFQPDLIIVDPWVSFVPAGTRLMDSNVIRSLLNKLAHVVRETGCAMVLIRHLVKSKHENALYQGGGTMDLIAFARSALRVGGHPHNPDIKVMAHLKHNVGPRGPSWIYKLEASSESGKLPNLTFVSETDITADQLNNATFQDRQSPGSTAKDFLTKELADGRRPAKELEDAAVVAGIALRTLNRAKKQLKVISKQKKGKWYWQLPE